MRRTQVALIESGPIARRLGWYSLSFQTLGADQKEGGVQVAAPFARMEQLLPILAEAGYPMPPPRAPFRRVPRRAPDPRAGPVAALRHCRRGVGHAASSRALGVAGQPSCWRLGLFAVLRWRKHAYALGEQCPVRFGQDPEAPRLDHTCSSKTQTISVGQGPCSAGSVWPACSVDTVGASPIRSPEIVDLDAAEADPPADRLLGLFSSRSANGPRPATNT